MKNINALKLPVKVLSMILALAIGLAPAAALAEGAAEGFGTVRFVCRDTAGFLCPGVTIGCYADGEKKGLKATGTSDAAGVVEFAGLEAATYWFAILAVPEEIAKTDAVIPLAAESGKTVEFKLVVEKRGLAEFSYGGNQLRGIEAAGTMSPAFHPDTKRYTLRLDECTGKVTVKPLAAEPSSKVYIAGKRVSSKTVALKPGGKTTLKIQVKPARGKSTFYYVTVVRAKSTNAALKALKASRGAVQPAFAGDTEAYTLSLARSQRSVRLVPRLSDRYATWTMYVDGKRTRCSTLALKVGQTRNVVVKVRAQAGNTRAYTVAVTRSR